MSSPNSLPETAAAIDVLANLSIAISTLSMILILMIRVFLPWLARRRSRHGGRFYWADILLPPKIQRDVDANLDDMMPIWTKAYGKRRAHRIRRWQVLRVVTGHWLTPLWLAFVKVLEIVRGK